MREGANLLYVLTSSLVVKYFRVIVTGITGVLSAGRIFVAENDFRSIALAWTTSSVSNAPADVVAVKHIMSLLAPVDASKIGGAHAGRSIVVVEPSPCP